jgi:L-lactate dehydrogenase complex protein LldG
VSGLTPDQSNSEARAVIMQSIRAHLAESARFDSDHSHAPVVVSDQTPATSPVTVSTVAAFRERLESVGGHCVTVRDDDEAARALAEIVSELQAQDGAKRIALSDAPLVAQLTRGINAPEMTVCPAAADLFNYDVGISTAQAGIAETGTLILEVEKERHRLVSLLPPVHIGIVRSGEIHPTIGDALTALRGDDDNSLSRAITFITGPSRTADIELTLTVGVHGPKELYVIVIDPHVADPQ